MLICKALVKYGYSEFKLEILEFTARDTLIVREQYFLDKLHPEYNILKFSDSSLGYKHKEATKKLLSESKKKIVMDEPTRELIRISLSGRIISPEAIEKKRLSDCSRQSVTITNLQTGEMKDLPSLSAASSFLGITRYMLSNYMLNNTACKGYNIVMKGKAQPLASGYNSTQPITLTHKETGEILEFSSMSKGVEYLKISQQSLSKYLKKKGNVETIKGYEPSFSSSIHKDVRESR